MRSSELRPYSSIVVDGTIVRPGAKRASRSLTRVTLDPAVGPAPADARDDCPTSHPRSSRRFSLRVPSVRGSSGPGQTATARIFCGSFSRAFAFLITALFLFVYWRYRLESVSVFIFPLLFIIPMR